MKKEHFEILLEDIREKVELVLEGYSVLNNKIDRVEQGLGDKIDCLSTKIDGVANDLVAHRADTESHPKGYKVSE
jgi:hypothetical protein